MIKKSQQFLQAPNMIDDAQLHRRGPPPFLLRSIQMCQGAVRAAEFVGSEIEREVSVGTHLALGEGQGLPSQSLVLLPERQVAALHVTGGDPETILALSEDHLPFHADQMPVLPLPNDLRIVQVFARQDGRDARSTTLASASEVDLPVIELQPVAEEGGDAVHSLLDQLRDAIGHVLLALAHRVRERDVACNRQRNTFLSFWLCHHGC